MEAAAGPGQFNGVLIDVDAGSGRARAIERIAFREEG
jgi:calcineurin-like phosphoesterase